MTHVTKDVFINDRQGRTFADVWDDVDQPFDDLLEFFNDEQRQRRMEEAELHHDRPALAGVVRELESQEDIYQYLAEAPQPRAKRFRQSVGVLVRIIMEGRGWQKTGRKGSLGVRKQAETQTDNSTANHNTGGLSFWFLRAERYQQPCGSTFQTVKERCSLMAVSKSAAATS